MAPLPWRNLRAGRGRSLWSCICGRTYHRRVLTSSPRTTAAWWSRTWTSLECRLLGGTGAEPNENSGRWLRLISECYSSANNPPIKNVPRAWTSQRKKKNDRYWLNLPRTASYTNLLCLSLVGITNNTSCSFFSFCSCFFKFKNCSSKYWSTTAD